MDTFLYNCSWCTSFFFSPTRVYLKKKKRSKTKRWKWAAPIHHSGLPVTLWVSTIQQNFSLWKKKGLNHQSHQSAAEMFLYLCVLVLHSHMFSPTTPELLWLWQTVKFKKGQWTNCSRALCSSTCLTDIILGYRRKTNLEEDRTDSCAAQGRRLHYSKAVHPCVRLHVCKREDSAYTEACACLPLSSLTPGYSEDCSELNYSDVLPLLVPTQWYM